MKLSVLYIFYGLLLFSGSTEGICQNSSEFEQGKKIVDSLIQSTPKYQPFINEEDGLQAISLASEIEYHIGEAKSLNKLAIFYRTIQNEEKALSNVLSARVIIDEYGSVEDRMDVMYSLTEVYRYFNYHKEALECAEITMNLAEKLQDSLVIGKVLWNLANVHLKINQKDEYFNLGEQALSVFKNIDNVEEMITAYIGLGSIVLNMDKKISYFNNAETLLSALKDERTRDAKKLLLHSFLAITYLDIENYVQAEVSTLIALEIAQKNGNVNVEAMMNGYLSRIQFYYYQDYQKAIFFAKKYLNFEKSISRYYYVVPAAQFLMELYTASGQPEEALNYADVAMLYQDSLYWANRKVDATEIEKAFELEEKYKEVQMLEEQRRTRTILGIGGTAFFLLLAGFFYRQRQLKNRHLQMQEQFSIQLQKEKETVELQNDQLDKLNSAKDRLFSIIGHDLRGPLFSLQGLDEQINYLLETNQISRLKELGGSMEQTSKYLTETLNNLLNWSMLQMGSFPYQPKEVILKNIAENNCALFEGTAKRKKIELIIDAPDNVTAYVDETAINTVLRNLVSNAIKFSDQGEQVKLITSSKNGTAQLIVADTGIGMSDSQVGNLLNGLSMKGRNGTSGEQSAGLGLILCRDLVNQNGGIIDVKSKVGVGTTITLNLPI